MKKLKIAVVYGGISSEHDISVISAKSVMENLDKEEFEVIPVLISKEGDFDIDLILSSDVVFPVLHGVGGEDGSIQGFCEMLDKPYVGSGIEASALALDKIASKQIWKNLKLPIPSFYFFSKSEYLKNPNKILKSVTPPVFVKPANTGSSIGISLVKRKMNLKKAISLALKYDNKIIIEKALKNIREIEVSILGNDELSVSLPGEIIPADEFYSYKAKYKLSSELIIPADISSKKTKEIQNLAEKAYRALGCRGMARVDFFLERPEGKVYINEVNTIPGFTDISMYPKLMEASGIKYKDLLSKLIKLVIK